MTEVNYAALYAARPEHVFVGPRRCGKSTIVAALHSYGYWAYEHTKESGDDILRIYATQRKLYEHDLSAKMQPRMFFSDAAWWQYSARFHYVNPHLRSEISFPEAELERMLPEQDVDWLYRYGSDARDRLLPELACGVAMQIAAGASVSMAARTTGAGFIEAYYPELVAPLCWAIPHVSKFSPHVSSLRIPRAGFESRVRSFRAKYPLPHKLTAQNFTEFLIACGIVEFSHTYYLRFAPTFAAGLQELKNTLTHTAIQARLKKS